MIGDENIHLSTGKLLYIQNTKIFPSQSPIIITSRRLTSRRGGHWGLPKTTIPKKKKKEKYRYAVSKIDEIPIPHLRSVTLTLSFMHLACLFFLRHVYTRNQPQQSPRENVRPLIDRHNDRKVRSLDVLPISS